MTEREIRDISNGPGRKARLRLLALERAQPPRRQRRHLEEVLLAVVIGAAILTAVWLFGVSPDLADKSYPNISRWEMGY